MLFRSNFTKFGPGANADVILTLLHEYSVLISQVLRAGRSIPFAILWAYVQAVTWLGGCSSLRKASCEVMCSRLRPLSSVLSTIGMLTSLLGSPAERRYGSGPWQALNRCVLKTERGTLRGVRVVPRRDT